MPDRWCSDRHSDPPRPFQHGDRIQLLEMVDDPYPIEPGTTGRVVGCAYVNFGARKERGFWQVTVVWDNGRQLMLSMPPDRAEKVEN